jgi:hypothetical protein
MFWQAPRADDKMAAQRTNTFQFSEGRNRVSSVLDGEGSDDRIKCLLAIGQRFLVAHTKIALGDALTRNGNQGCRCI